MKRRKKTPKKIMRIKETITTETKQCISKKIGNARKTTLFKCNFSCSYNPLGLFLEQKLAPAPLKCNTLLSRHCSRDHCSWNCAIFVWHFIPFLYKILPLSKELIACFCCHCSGPSEAFYIISKRKTLPNQSSKIRDNISGCLP